MTQSISHLEGQSKDDKDPRKLLTTVRPCTHRLQWNFLGSHELAVQRPRRPHHSIQAHNCHRSSRTSTPFQPICLSLSLSFSRQLKRVNSGGTEYGGGSGVHVCAGTRSILLACSLTLTRSDSLSNIGIISACQDGRETPLRLKFTVSDSMNTPYYVLRLLC